MDKVITMQSTVFSQGSVAAGEVGKSIIIMLQIKSVYGTVGQKIIQTG